MRVVAVLCVLAVTFSVGCDDAGGGSTATTSGASSTGAGAGGGGTGGAGSGGEKTNTDIPPVQMPGDPAVDCPAAFSSAAPAAGQNEGFDAGGQTRGFYLDLPDTSFDGPRPLFVAFHGTTGQGVDFHARAELTDFAARGFITVSPDGVGNGTIWPVWDAMHTASDPDTNNADLAYFDSLVSCLAAHYAIDQNRIYIGGHSAGGIMSNYMLQRRSEMIAGAIVGSGVSTLR